MKQFLKIVIGVAAIVSATSCKKTTELEIPNPNQQDESNFWKSATDARLGVNAIYRNFTRNGAPYSRWLPFYMDVRSDDGYSTSGWPELQSISGLNITQYSFEVNIDTWAHHWIGVNYANQVLANVPNIEMDATLKNQYLGEAKFLRALYYYDLVTIWGNVPLLLTPSRPSDRPMQATPAQVWTQIEKDLTEAAAALPVSYPSDELGRATKGAAYGLLGEKTVGNTRDPRLAVTVLYDSTDERGPDFTSVYGSSWTSHGYDPDYNKRAWYHKYLDDYYRINEFEVFNSPINFRVIRYADVLLMYAEALNNLGQTNNAYQYVDRVRQRANLAKLSVIRPGMNQQQFLRQIMHERVTELSGECLRWNDLARWGYFDDPAKLAELKARDPEFNNFRIPRNKYMPIPQSELDINANLKQNTGW
ncbi:MAG: RagB/SusD family nutrient uptake outer membrane protein [Chitinophagaceae bacterium]|nr:MAG: RagB/SusD family nutrient uptake outer membrane protein [Chitinophagaceae bacterium]